MEEPSEEAKTQLEEQKKNCPFCKIIKGEIPSKKVYEDDKVLAVLDINPAMPGHVLLMPKEHYPIMPYIPPDEFKHLFTIAKKLAGKIQEAMVTASSNIFIANGWAAGQQAAHFMIHIIPREENDGIFLFNLAGETGFEKDKEEEAFKLLSNNLPIMIENHFKKVPAEWHKPKQVGAISRKLTKEQVIKIIDQNPQLKELIEKNPSVVIAQIKVNEQLKTLFKDVDINEVIKHFKPDFKPTKEAEFEEKEENTEEKEENKEKEKIKKTHNTKAELLDMLGGSSGEIGEDGDDEDTEESSDEEIEKDSDGETEYSEEDNEDKNEDSEGEEDKDSGEEEDEKTDLDAISNLFK